MKQIATISGGNASAPPAPREKMPGLALFGRVLDGISNRANDIDPPTGRYRGTLHDDQRRMLQGRAVTPADATEVGKLVTLDGTGRIVDLPSRLPDAFLHSLVAKSITPLVHTPAPQDIKRITPGEAVVDLHRLLVDHPVAIDTSGIQRFLRDTYLAGGSHRSGLDMSVRMLREVLAGHPDLLGKVEMIASQVVDKRHVTRENDNLYGRTFDSAFATHLVRSDAPVFQAVMRGVHDELVMHFQREATDALCQRIAEHFRRDPAPWMSTVPEAARFIRSPSVVTFVAALEAASHAEYGPDFMLSMAVKYMMASQSCSGLVSEATRLYNDVIRPQRQLRNAMAAQQWSFGRYGVTLPYQPEPARDGVNLGWGIRPIDRYMPNVEQITEHDQRARDSERAIGIGMSGSANLLGALFAEIHRRDSTFPVKAAQLLSAAHLTFSGGHSINEAFTTFNYRATKSLIPTPYLEMVHHFEDDDVTQDCGNIVRDAVDHAFNAVVEASRHSA